MKPLTGIYGPDAHYTAPSLADQVGAVLAASGHTGYRVGASVEDARVVVEPQGGTTVYRLSRVEGWQGILCLAGWQAQVGWFGPQPVLLVRAAQGKDTL